MKRVLFLTIALILVSASADARPRHHTRHVHVPERTVSTGGGLFGGFFSAGGSNLVATARAYVGTNPTGQARLWCADFVNLVVRKLGYRGTGSRAARSFVRFGRPAPRNCTNCIAVLTRRGGGHVGVVEARDARGNPILVSGNSVGRRGRRHVGVGVYSANRVIAYRWP